MLNKSLKNRSFHAKGRQYSDQMKKDKLTNNDQQHTT